MIRGDLVRVEGRRGDFLLRDPIVHGDTVVGWWTLSPGQMQVPVRLESIKLRSRPR